MNSVELANKAWDKLRNFSIQLDWHVELAVNECVRNIPETLPDFVIENATRRLMERHQAMKAAIKDLHSLTDSEMYQARLKEIGKLSGRIE